MNPIIFTIGRTEFYEKLLDDFPEVPKMGRRDDYPGGSVFETYGDARAHCPADYTVYGVAARWGVDTAPSRDGDHHDLLVDARIIRLLVDGAAHDETGQAFQRAFHATTIDQSNG